MNVTDKLFITNEDNMQLMSRYPDNYFDLAIVDPPYGVEQMTGKEFSHNRGKLKNRQLNKGADKINVWDIRPDKEYFDELFRVSKNQIIWGGNYFELPPYRCPIAWDKCQPWENFSQIELAWTSFNKPASIVKIDNRTGGKIHPTQKPIELYKWLLHKYAVDGDKILDTHLGSGSIALACHDYGFELTACELDPEYYELAIDRINTHTSQKKLF
jgi:site-specific DNA-methyltransferase (adenine-specific)